MVKWRHSNHNDSGSLLASIFILALGASCSIFTVAAMAPQSLPAAMWVVGSFVGAFIVFVILQRFGRVPQANLSFLLASQRNRRDDGLKDYQPRKANENRNVPTGTNKPISAQEAHEIKITSANTWVPSPSTRRPRK